MSNPRKNIPPEVNRERVRRTMQARDRINVILPKGTVGRIRALGFVPGTFAKELIFSKLEELEWLEATRKNKRDD